MLSLDKVFNAQSVLKNMIKGSLRNEGFKIVK